MSESHIIDICDKAGRVLEDCNLDTNEEKL